MAVIQVGSTTIEYALAPRMVVYSHGFGVGRDSNGLFADIASALSPVYGYALFDYNQQQSEGVIVLSDFIQQQETLSAVLKWAHSQQEVERVSLVGHSMGCIVPALLKPEVAGKVTLLAPPTSIGERTRRYFTGKAGAVREDDKWRVPRRDGTVSIIPESLFEEYEAVDAEAVLRAYAEQQPYALVIPGSDEVLRDVDYRQLQQLAAVQSFTLDGADHNFTGAARDELLQLFRQLYLG